MSEIVPAPQTPPPGAVPPTFGRDPRDESLRRICLLDYALHIGGLILSAGLFSVVALILNYLKRDDAAGTIYQSHMNWMIRTFWWTLFWMAALFLPMSAALAQGEAPVTLTDGQVNQIVQQVTGAVLKEMKAGQPAEAPASPAPVKTLEEGFSSYLQAEGIQFFEQFENTLRAYPALADEIGSIISRVDGRPQGRAAPSPSLAWWR